MKIEYRKADITDAESLIYIILRFIVIILKK